MSTAVEKLRSEAMMVERASSPVSLDFDDVFGGPPRNFSIQESRVVNLSFSQNDGWKVPKDGMEIVGEKRHDFFDDIFGSRMTSPAPKSDILATSFPTQSSFDSKSAMAMDTSTCQQNHFQYKVDSTANRITSSYSSSSSSRFHHQSPLASFSSDDSSSRAIPNQKIDIENSKSYTGTVDSPLNCNQFHFSIYKWAGKGGPTLTTLIDRRNFKSLSRNDRLTSSNGRLEGDFIRNKQTAVMNQDFPSYAQFDSFEEESKEKYFGSGEKIIEPKPSVQALHDILETQSEKFTKSSFVVDQAVQDVKIKRLKSLWGIDGSEKDENEVVPGEPEVKPRSRSLFDEAEPRGNAAESRVCSDSKNMNNSSLKDVASNSPSESSAKGKVKEFVQIFNKDSGSKHEPDAPKRSQSHRWKGAGVGKRDYDVNMYGAKTKLNNVDKVSEVSLKVDINQNLEDTCLKSQTKTASFRKSFSVSDPKRILENSDDLFEDYFMVQELSPPNEKATDIDQGWDEKKAIDSKIHQWSFGKKGNIRSLLSTLQLVLWPGNGWKPVALVDLIEANAVKRAYQKALLRLHPDKLQQNGAVAHQKYIAGKVFDILQEAWDQFNALAPL